MLASIIMIVFMGILALVLLEFIISIFYPGYIYRFMKHPFGMHDANRKKLGLHTAQRLCLAIAVVGMLLALVGMLYYSMFDFGVG